MDSNEQFVRANVLTCKSCGTHTAENATPRTHRGGKSWPSCPVCGASLERDDAAPRPANFVPGVLSQSSETQYPIFISGLSVQSMEDTCEDPLPTCPGLAPAAPASGEASVVEAMCYAYCMNNPSTGITVDRYAMTAAYHVCRRAVMDEVGLVSLEAELREAKQECERLSAPVSDEEAQQVILLGSIRGVGRAIYALLASRKAASKETV